ncbi:hypothetical protein B5E58_02665 [Tyzzerella sp. An114]|uniref:CarD family transcriptional regulator n=1 Tax=Tyzzerella sp. An114 TaxID=1965545 RepID=UPI000B448EA0|nr:CarD family transcriptional regulator [Tyzzerella sp. An114]OUQ60011.1 hypothetical protein B5E58_02665 [Tyzzerella sp. An114]HIT72885.1 CarD family transcriptional regulator [Candidatus Fimicola cottocaccae]
MFNKGDKIVYPVYGGGIVEDIEKTENGECYYLIKTLFGGLKIKLSTAKAENIGLRKVSSEDEIIETIKQVNSSNIVSSDNWNQRYKENLEKIKTGRLMEVAEVAKNLNSREKRRNLSGVEKKMFTNAKQIIVSEIILSNNIVKEKAEELLANLLFNC